jgi:hypothetical protein
LAWQLANTATPLRFIAGAHLAWRYRMRLRTRSIVQVTVAVSGLIAVAACSDPPVANPHPTVTQQTPIRVVPGNKVDLLFMVDNSTSMGAMQRELQAKFGEFLKVFDRLAASNFFVDLHIGVVTSDYGAGSKGGSGCDKAGGGQHGFLQIGQASCGQPVGHPYISYVYGGSNANNLPPGKQLADTFTCMASVGASGCGYEHQLESVYQALKNNKENAGFLRPDALLAVVFVTNEDDGSAPPDSIFFNFDVDQTWNGPYGLFDTFRQTKFGIQCGGTMLSPDGTGGVVTGCLSIPNSPLITDYEYDIERYINLFKLPIARGGIKASPDDILLFAIDGSDDPFEARWVLKPKLDPPEPEQTTCPTPLDTNRGNCALRLIHSCMNAQQHEFFADSAIRLNTVLRSFSKDSQIKSICGEDPKQTPDFTAALQALGDAIAQKLPGCIPAKLTDPQNPDCTVTDVSPNPDGSENEVVIQKCDPSNPGMATYPCWRVEKKDQCTSAPEGLAVNIDRNGQQAPAEAVTRVECSTKAE